MVPRRHARPIEPKQLSVLTTPRLLAYRNRLLRLETSAELSDFAPTELMSCDPQLMYFKTDARWRPLYEAVLRELARRPK